MSDSQLPVLYQGDTVVQRARQEIEWVDERDLSTLQPKEPWAAGALSLVSGGGGQVYVGEYAKGLGLIAATAGAVALAWVLPAAVAILPFLGVSLPSSLAAWRKARAINRYLAAKRDEYDRSLPYPPAHRLLAAMKRADTPAVPAPTASPPTSSPAALPQAAPIHGALIERLRKLLLLARSGVITLSEHRERKIDVLADVATGISRDAVDDLLFELLPLCEQGVVDDEDIAFIKDLGES